MPRVHTPSVHPYDDTDVIDAHAPRFNQATVGLLSALALVTGWWWLLGLLAVQLIVGLRFGRRFCLPCVLYFEVVQPRVGEGRIEDARPPRFANIIGATVLSGATLAYLAGLRTVGMVLGGTVAVLALLAAVTGLCVGCELYRLSARLRGIRPGDVHRIDLTELAGAAPLPSPARGGTSRAAEPAPETLVQFTHPLCSDCRDLEERLRDSPSPLLTVDVSRRPDLAHRYRVLVVPTAFRVASDGRVLERLAG
jgi:Domain of unknown function (DUF4395)